MGCFLRCLAGLFTIVALVLLAAMGAILFTPFLLFFFAVKVMLGGL